MAKAFSISPISSPARTTNVAPLLSVRLRLGRGATDPFPCLRVVPSSEQQVRHLDEEPGRCWMPLSGNSHSVIGELPEQNLGSCEPTPQP